MLLSAKEIASLSPTKLPSHPRQLHQELAHHRLEFAAAPLQQCFHHDLSSRRLALSPWPAGGSLGPTGPGKG